MPSFDAVLEPNLVEIRNAVEQAVKEIGTRFDFKGTSAAIALAETGAKARELTLTGDSDFQLQQLRELLGARMSKRNVDLRFLDFSGTPQKIGGDRLTPFAEALFTSLLRVGFRNIHFFIHHQSENFAVGMPTDLSFKFAARQVIFKYLEEI